MAMKFKKALKARGGFKPSRIARTAKKVGDAYVKGGKTAAVQEAFTQMTSADTINGLMSLAVSAAKRYKSPIGANGLSLEPPSTRDQSIRSDAVGDITSSSTLYMYRPSKRRLNDVGDVNYAQKTFVTNTLTSSANVQAGYDISMLDAVPVLNNPDTDQKYTNLSLKKCFDDLLLATGASPGPVTSLKYQQTSLHVKSLTAELTLVNNNESAALIDIYEVVPQHTLAGSTYSSANYSVGYMSPLWTYSVGLSSDTTMLEDTLAYTAVASRPQDSTTFNRTWKIVKQLKLNIGSKGIHRHRSAYAINKTVSYQEYAQVSTSGGKFAGWNPTYLIVIRGNPSSTDFIATASSVSATCNLQLNYSAQMTGQSKVIVYDNTN